ncbi:hypothetical protein M8J75_001077 [Diaphorina citri]|nr:hypothetical protein M8J75_001077 [Diaphorina citri]
MPRILSLFILWCYHLQSNVLLFYFQTRRSRRGGPGIGLSSSRVLGGTKRSSVANAEDSGAISNDESLDSVDVKSDIDSAGL